MTDLQRRFIEFFRACGDETEAARLAGYKVPHIYGKRCLNVLKPYFDDTSTPPVDSDSIADRDEVLRFYSAILRNDFSAGVVSIKDRLEAAKVLLKLFESDSDSKSSFASDWISALISDDCDEN